MEEEERQVAARDFSAFESPLEMVTSFRYLGWVGVTFGGAAANNGNITYFLLIIRVRLSQKFCMHNLTNRTLFKTREWQGTTYRNYLCIMCYLYHNMYEHIVTMCTHMMISWGYDKYPLVHHRLKIQIIVFFVWIFFVSSFCRAVNITSMWKCTYLCSSH